MQSTKASGLSMLFRWSPLKSQPSNTLPRSRCKHACCLHNDHVYVVGGKDGNVPLREIWKFHIGNYKWEKLTFRGDSLPILEGHTLVAHKRLLYLFGGGFEDDITESCLWIINPDLQHVRRHWVETYASHPGIRRHHTAVLFDNAVYVYGGHVDIKGSKSDLWAFHTDDEEWEQVIPRQPPSTIPEGRHGHTAVVYGRDMWVLGGLVDLNNPKTDFWKFSFHTERWERIKHKYGPPNLVGHSAIVVKDTMIVFGGESSGNLNNALWVFNFCSFHWTRVNVQGPMPSPRVWQRIIPITSVTLRVDNSIRTSSVPYLKNKNEASKLKRPKSSPAYCSARNQVRPDLSRYSGNQNFVPAQLIPRPKDLSPSSRDFRLPIVMTTPRDKTKEDTSPLLYNRQMSCNSVASTGSQGKGVDNPAWERDASLEKVADVTEILEFHNFESREHSPTKVQSSKYSLEEFVEMCNLRENQNSLESALSEKENVIPGQVKTPVKRYVKKQQKHSGKTIEMKEMDKFSDLGLSEELVLEDLEFVENFYSIDRSADSTLRNPFSNQTINRNQNGGSLSNLHSVELRPISCIQKNYKGDTSGAVESKSSSLSNIHETRLDNNDFGSTTQKSSSLHVIPPRRGSIHCWEDDDSGSVDSKRTDTVSSESGVKLPQVGSATQASTRTQNASGQPDQSGPTDKSGMSGSKSLDQCREGETAQESYVRQEMDTPYFLLFGGKEAKGSNIRLEPMVVWHSTVIVRHSDINHGEFHKSSMVI